MSKRADVLLAVKQMIEAACPGQDVKGFNNDTAKPDRVPQNGLIVVRAGDPGDAEVDLSPLSYHYNHEIPVEIAVLPTPANSGEVLADQIMVGIGDAILADRTLGGLVDFLDMTAPDVDDFTATGATVGTEASFSLIATYSTSSPLN